MIRIIGGDLKRRRLATAPDRSIRPTGDRIREAIFNIIGARVRGAVVLDLFAGTGALAIEALSRGAAAAVLIDHHRLSLNLIHRNLRACGLESRGRVVQWDITGNLNCLASQHPRFNLVFMDPPYGRDLVAPALEHLQRSGALAPHARLMVEHGAQESLVDMPDDFALADQRRYGKTLVSFLTYML